MTRSVMITLTSLALCLALGVAVWAQEDEGPPLSEFGPFAVAGKTDAEGRFSAEFTAPFPLAVTGLLTGPEGNPLAGLEVTVVLEPRPGIPTILGIGHIGAVWLDAVGYGPASIMGFTIASGRSPVVEVGPVVLAGEGAVPRNQWRVEVRRVDGDTIHFTARYHDATGRAVTVIQRTAKKVDQLPQFGRIGEFPKCRWIVVDTGASWAFYHSDGTQWNHRTSVEVNSVRARPTQCIPGAYYAYGWGEHRYVDYCEREGFPPVRVGYWTEPEPEPEPDPDPWIPVP